MNGLELLPVFECSRHHQSPCRDSGTSIPRSQPGTDRRRGARYTRSADESERVVRASGAAVLHGDIDALQRVLAENAVLYPDGGGEVLSALRPILGRDRVARLLLSVTTKFPLGDSATVSEETINGVPGFYIEEEGRLVQTIAFDIRGGRILAVYVVRNPDKLARLARRV